MISKLSNNCSEFSINWSCFTFSLHCVREEQVYRWCLFLLLLLTLLSATRDLFDLFDTGLGPF